MTNKGLMPWLAYIAVCIVWGTTYLVIRIGVESFPPEMFGGIRFVISGLLVILFAKIMKYDFPTAKRDYVNASITGLLMLLGGHGLVVYAEQWVHSGVTAVILAIAPLYIAVIEMIMFRKFIINKWGWAGLLISFGGVAFLGLSGKSIGNIDMFGTVLLLSASFLFSLGSVFSKKVSSSGGMAANLGIQMLAGGIGLVMAGILLGEVPKIVFDTKVLWAMIYLIIFGSFIGYGSYIYVLSKWPATKAGTYSYVNTVIAVILGAVILNEKITLTVVISMITILLGVIMVQMSKRKEANK